MNVCQINKKRVFKDKNQIKILFGGKNLGFIKDLCTLIVEVDYRYINKFNHLKINYQYSGIILNR